MTIKKELNGLIKLGKTKIVVLITSKICVEKECCSSRILNIWEIHIRPIKAIIFINMYLK